MSEFSGDRRVTNTRRGVLFLLLVMVISCVNDAIAKLLGQRLDALQIIFFRFFFSLITLLPIVLKMEAKVFETANLTFNFARGVLGVISFYLYTYAIMKISLVEVVTIMWIIPLFTMILAIFFLHERVTAERWTATMLGFCGLAFLIYHDSGSMPLSFKWIYLVPCAAAFLFAIQDIMIKKMIVTNENSCTILLYFAMITSALAFFPAMAVWQTPNMRELLLLSLLGLFANLMQYLLMKAFDAAKLSVLAPYRYLEFFISALIGYLLFNELPGTNVLVSAMMLIPATLYLTLVRRG
ncbi:MAG: DMT family transporter [Holosporaceae bacterium]|jgi:S-adenosylmethionine uptake transporter|nr:DMT family transporter [Holosporaceae bacterium]